MPENDAIKHQIRDAALVIASNMNATKDTNRLIKMSAALSCLAISSNQDDEDAVRLILTARRLGN